MPRYVALLGGINVGGHRVAMSDLRALVESLGFANVSTFIASGNVVFDTTARDAPRLETRIERRLGDALGYGVPTFIRSVQEIASIAAYEPFPPAVTDGGFHSLSVLFLADALPASDARRLLDFRTPLDEFHIRGREIYWLCRVKMTESLVSWRQVEKAVALPRSTARNIRTVRSLASKYGIVS